MKVIGLLTLTALMLCGVSCTGRTQEPIVKSWHDLQNHYGEVVSLEGSCTDSGVVELAGGCTVLVVATQSFGREMTGKRVRLHGKLKRLDFPATQPIKLPNIRICRMEDCTWSLLGK